MARTKRKNKSGGKPEAPKKAKAPKKVKKCESSTESDDFAPPISGSRPGEQKAMMPGYEDFLARGLDRDHTTKPDEPSAESDDESLRPLSALLNQGYNLDTESVRSSTKINSKVKTILWSLNRPDSGKDVPRIVVIEPKIRAATKAISIVEIVKREVEKQGGVWYQYNAIVEVVTEIPDRRDDMHSPKASVKDEETGHAKVVSDATAEEAKASAVADESTIEVVSQGNEEPEEEAFETMNVCPPAEAGSGAVDDAEKKPKIRVVPALRIFLTRKRIEQLRRKHGEQTNAKS
ncbi:MAG: hypothetical protein M1837_004733 [Sclerophora amabilis]|nr:MAG: hypothetical protein M1837_004733 [Sclerophora amabilis]